MDSEQNRTDPEDLAKVWQNAEQRRAEDIMGWFNSFFERRRRLKASNTGVALPQGSPILR
jgi:hypothetical protein